MDIKVHLFAEGGESRGTAECDTVDVKHIHPERIRGLQLLFEN